MMVRLLHAARTDVGMIRSGNEDNFAVAARGNRGLFIVADGMGGHAAGEVASEMAVQTIEQELDGLRDLDDSTGDRLDQALRKANRNIHERTMTEVDKQGMGTTASVLLIYDKKYLIGQVGDSRVYLLRDGALHQLTKDHSYVQEQVDAGFLTPEQARYHPYSNVITRCVGASPEVQPDIYHGRVERRRPVSRCERRADRHGRRPALADPAHVARGTRAQSSRADLRGERARRTGQHHGHRRAGCRRRRRANGRLEVTTTPLG